MPKYAHVPFLHFWDMLYSTLYSTVLHGTRPMRWSKLALLTGLLNHGQKARRHIVELMICSVELLVSFNF